MSDTSERAPDKSGMPFVDPWVKNPNHQGGVPSMRCDLLLAVRGGYLNAYARGQSIFKIGSEHGKGINDGKPRVAIHFKYLIKGNLEGASSYIPFDGSKFDIPVAFTHYKPGSTLPILVRTACRFAGVLNADLDPGSTDLCYDGFHIADQEGNKRAPVRQFEAPFSAASLSTCFSFLEMR